VIPTPFFKYPFEFTVGFRRSFPVILMAYYSLYISLHSGNFYIGLAGIVMIGIVCTFFHSKLEDMFYVWIYAFSPKQFIWHKLKIATFSTMALCLPIVLTLAITHPGKIHLILAAQVLALLYVSNGVLGKYASVPYEISLLNGLLLTFSIMFPPLLLGTLPFFYLHAIEELDREGVLE
jgi:hypothetical protein